MSNSSFASPRKQFGESPGRERLMSSRTVANGGIQLLDVFYGSFRNCNYGIGALSVPGDVADGIRYFNLIVTRKQYDANFPVLLNTIVHEVNFGAGSQAVSVNKVSGGPTDFWHNRNFSLTSFGHFERISPFSVRAWNADFTGQVLEEVIIDAQLGDSLSVGDTKALVQSQLDALTAFPQTVGQDPIPPNDTYQRLKLYRRIEGTLIAQHSNPDGDKALTDGVNKIPTPKASYEVEHSSGEFVTLDFFLLPRPIFSIVVSKSYIGVTQAKIWVGKEALVLEGAPNGFEIVEEISCAEGAVPMSVLQPPLAECEPKFGFSNFHIEQRYAKYAYPPFRHSAAVHGLSPSCAPEVVQP